MNLNRDFFPMRPTATGKMPVPALVNELRGRFVIQPKLNGDRAILWVLDGEIYIHNRHGGEYRLMVRNRATFARLPRGTVLDGEVFGGKFHPFEVVRYGDLDLSERGAEARCRLAESLCGWLEIEWLFAEPSAEWLNAGAANAPQWEGVVCKRRDAVYRPCKKSHHESADWFKLKW